MQYRITLAAGVEKRQVFSGTNLVLLDLGTATEIDCKIELEGYAVEEFRGVKRGLKLNGPNFTAIKFLSAVDTVLEVIVSAANISVNYTEGATVNANILGTVPVSNDRGTLGTPVYVSGITYSDAPAVTLTNNAPVDCTATAAVLVAANDNRRGLRFTNIGTDPVAVGAAGLTWANRCLILNSGDSWVEERAANLAWAGICDAAKTASVTVQEVIS